MENISVNLVDINNHGYMGAVVLSLMSASKAKTAPELAELLPGETSRTIDHCLTSLSRKGVIDYVRASGGVKIAFLISNSAKLS